MRIDCSTRVWIALVALTAAAWAAGESGAMGPALAAAVLAATFVKGRLVAREFMGLAAVRPLWRGLVLGWLGSVVGLIGLAYWMGVS